MQPNNQQPNGSKKRPIQPEYEEDEDVQPRPQASAFLRRSNLPEQIVRPVEENKDDSENFSESDEEENMSP